jgi:hypothetical protein
MEEKTKETSKIRWIETDDPVSLMTLDFSLKIPHAEEVTDGADKYVTFQIRFLIKI